MAQSIPSLAEPAMLAWCRKNARLTTGEVARSLDREEREIVAWEDGTESPTFAQLCRFAKLCKRPVAVFYLPEPPKDFTILRDFRRLPGKKAGFSPALAYLIRLCRERQEWLSEYLSQDGDEPLAFVGSASIDDSPLETGRALRQLLGVSIDEQRRLPNKEQAFRFWRDRCDAAGVCVFVATRNLEIEEMRGFALPEEFAPVVVVNGRDSYSGKTFTLLHEMVHILLGVGGVSDRNVTVHPRNDEQKIEVFCNAVAAEALVPSDDFSRRAAKSEDLDNALPLLADFYRVSEEVIARRVYDLGIRDRNFYEAKRLEYIHRRPPAHDDSEEFRIPRATVILNNVGGRFSRAAIAAFHAGDIGGVELSNLLNMRLQFLPSLESKLSAKAAS